jgi:hypothetical protein
MVGNETIIGGLGEDAQEAFNGALPEAPADRMAVAVDQRDSAEVQAPLWSHPYISSSPARLTRVSMSGAHLAGCLSLHLEE